MKPLGYDKMINFGYEDCADILQYGSPSAKSHIKGKGGVIRNSMNPKSKASSRRIYKRVSRNEGKETCKNYKKDYE